MKILMLNYEFPPLGGGAGNATRFLLNQFANYSDLQIDLISSSTGEKKVFQYSDNITVHLLDIGKHGKNMQRQTTKDLLTYTFRAYQYTKKLLGHQSFDLCHAFFAIPSGYLAWKFKIPYIISLRGTDVPGHNKKYNTIYKIFSPLIKKTIQKARAVVANSHDLQQEIFGFFQRDYRVINNGIDLQFFIPVQKESGLFQILSAGRLHAVKNFDLLIKGYAGFKRQQPDTSIKLVIAGEGPEEKNLKRLVKKLDIKESVEFLGHLTKEKLRTEYQRCSVFVLLSEKEGMSNTVLEAMACGAPILATNTGGATELIDLTNGLVLNHLTVSAVAESLAWFYSNVNDLTKYGQASRKKAEQYSWHKSAEKYYSLYQRIHELA